MKNSAAPSTRRSGKEVIMEIEKPMMRPRWSCVRISSSARLGGEDIVKDSSRTWARRGQWARASAQGLPMASSSYSSRIARA